jgi:hypothetical protein
MITPLINEFQLAFTIPLGTKPDMCFDEITPNGMHEDMSCAWTGALVMAGGIGSVVWGTCSPFHPQLTFPYPYVNLFVYSLPP